jgi:peroxiredoxin
MAKPPRLQDRLDGVRAGSQPEWVARYDRLVAALRKAGIGEGALKAGDECPQFMLSNAEGMLAARDELLANGPLVLSFYRGKWCPYCVTELEALQEAMPDIAKAGATLAAVTAEACGGALMAKRQKNFSFEILCDPDNGLALNFGLVFRLSDEVRDAYLAEKIDFPLVYGNESWFLPIPATYVVDPTGVIRHAYVNPEFRERMDPADIVTVLQSLATKEKASP